MKRSQFSSDLHKQSRPLAIRFTISINGCHLVGVQTGRVPGKVTVVHQPVKEDTGGNFSLDMFIFDLTEDSFFFPLGPPEI